MASNTCVIESSTFYHTADDGADELLDAAIEQAEDTINTEELFDIIVESVVYDDLNGLAVAVNTKDEAEAGRIVLDLIKRHRLKIAYANNGLECVT